jgi:ubiquitin C-terminal hydrolase
MTNTNEKYFLYEKPIGFGAGYLNLGNTCYMNTTIHRFTSLGDLDAYFFQKKFENENNGKLGYELHLHQNLIGQILMIHKNVTYVYDTILKNYPDCPLKYTIQFNQ